MWIERVEIEGFGNLSRTKVEFAEGKLNLIVEPNEYGKSTIAEAIWAVLFDFPGTRTTAEKLSDREARQPAAGAAYKACVDVAGDGLALRVVRDFSARTVAVFDRARADLEVTSRFLSGPADDDVGPSLTGMSRDLFRNTCYVEQRELDKNALKAGSEASSLLQALADSSGSATTSATAVSILEDALKAFPYQGIRMKSDKLLRQLEEDRRTLVNKLRALEAEHEAATSQLAQLDTLDEKLSALGRQAKAAEYFRLLMEAAELDARMLKAQERLLRVNDLKKDLAALSRFRDFPVERLKPVEELWTRRQSRLDDHKRTALELALKEKQLQARSLEVRERWENVSQFQVDDAQTLSSLARTLSEAKAELSDLTARRDEETARVKAAGVELDNLADVRKALLNLDSRDLDTASAYQAMMTSARGQIKDCEGVVWRARQIIPEIEEQRKAKLASCRNNFLLLAVLFVAMAAIVAAVMLGLHERWTDPVALVGILIMGGLAGAFAVNCTLLGQARLYRQKDADTAREDEQKNSALATDLHNKVLGLEIRLDDLARKAGVANGAELVKHIQAYATAAAQLKDLDLLEQMVTTRSSHILKLEGQMEPYLIRAGRRVDKVEPEAAFKLAEEINRYHEEARAVEASSSSLEHQQSELKFLSDELRDIDSQLKEHFTHAGVEHPEDPQNGYEEFVSLSKGYRQWEALHNELGRLEADTTSDLPVADLPGLIQRMQAQRDSLWGRIEQMAAANPDLARLSPADMTGSHQAQPGGAADMEDEVENLRKQREDLMVQLRAATRSYDDDYLRMVEELEELDRDIARIGRAKTAIELARDTFTKLSEEIHGHWSSRLNEISREMLAAIKTGFESLHFDPDLRLTARRAGQVEPLQTANINSQSSVGTREQIHLLARLAVCRYLSEKTSLPIILDEPFSESDDERFFSFMRFLLATVVGKQQVIIFTCHQSRHRWLAGELEEEERALINQCRLEPLAVLSDAGRRGAQ